MMELAFAALGLLVVGVPTYADARPLGKQQFDTRALNPQPLPPGPQCLSCPTKFSFGSKYSWGTLNPQPLPPGPDKLPVIR
jgi:hypothetical protein